MDDRRQARGCLLKGARLAALALAALFLIVTVLLVNQRAAVANLWEKYPPPGRQVLVNEHRLHIYCLGQGSPTIVIDAGNGSGSLEWRPIQAELMGLVRVCAYDRGGYFWSEKGPEPRAAATAVSELRTLLTRAGEQEPFLLVGHSLGGLHVQLYAAEHPEEVAGLILVDAPSVAEFQMESARQSNRAQVSFYQVMEFLSGSGVLRAAGPLGGESLVPESAAGLAPDLREVYLNLILDPTFYRTARLEIQAIPTSVGQLERALNQDPPFGDLPLIVLTAGQMNIGSPLAPILQPVPGARLERQRALAQLSSVGEQRVIHGSGHLMHIDAPAAVVQAAQDLLSDLAGGAD